MIPLLMLWIRFIREICLEGINLGQLDSSLLLFDLVMRWNSSVINMIPYSRLHGAQSSIALGIAINKPEQRIWCVDGDGAVLMHMVTMTVIGSNKPKNLIHIVINNGAHETVGGMLTVACLLILMLLVLLEPAVILMQSLLIRLNC